MIRNREISRSHLRIALAIFSGVFVVLILSGCAAKAVMQPPNAAFYILDLSDSGNPDDQFDRINQDVLKSLTRSSLGQPFEIDGVPASGPTVTIFSFVGNNSRVLKTFQMQDYEKASQLLDSIKDDTRAKSSWAKLTSTYQSVLEPILNSAPVLPLAQNSCAERFDEDLKDYFSGDQKRNELVGTLCQMATFTVNKYIKLTEYIMTEKKKDKNKGTSDVFGALESVNNSIEAILKSSPKANIKLTIATDGENFLARGNPLNSSSILRDNGDPCLAGEKLYKQLSVKSLREVEVELKGVGALIGDKAEWASKLDKFWRCFFEISK